MNIIDNGQSNITITKKEYASLLIRDMELGRLEVGGVDNWEWYGESLNPEDGTTYDEEVEAIKQSVYNND